MFWIHQKQNKINLSVKISSISVNLSKKDTPLKKVEMKVKVHGNVWFLSVAESYQYISMTCFIKVVDITDAFADFTPIFFLIGINIVITQYIFLPDGGPFPV